MSTRISRCYCYRNGGVTCPVCLSRQPSANALRTMELTTDLMDMRKRFEGLASDSSFGFRRSRRGTYVNPSVARDWKWFQLGVKDAGDVK